MDEETGGLDIKMLIHVFGDLDQVVAALAAGAACRRVTVFDTWQVLG